MNRRNFVKQVALWSAGTALAPLFTITPELMAMERPAPRLITGVSSDYQALLRSMLAKLGGMQAFVNKGDRVVVKPNIGWDRNVDQAANTHPLVVATLVEMALAAGASEVKVFDRTCNEQRRCYVNSGIQAALEAMDNKRVKLEHIDQRKFVPVTIKNGLALKEWTFYRDALEADCYINVPVAKHHGLSRLTLGLKNTMGVIGGRRGRLHQDMGNSLADINTVIKPQLTVIDASRILLRNGPQGGRMQDVKKLDRLLISADPVAADAYATTLFDLKPGDIDSTRAAHSLGLGEMDLTKIRIEEV